MSNNEESNIDRENLMQKLDDIEVELETQNDYLKTIKTLLIILVILQLPIVFFLLHYLYMINGITL